MIKLFRKLFSPKPAARPTPSVAPTGDLLLHCFSCGKQATRRELLLFPWWHVHSEAFVTMYYCTKCVHRARHELTRMLTTRHKDRLAHFLVFLEQQNVTDQPLKALKTQESIAYAMEMIERIATGKTQLHS